MDGFGIPTTGGMSQKFLYWSQKVLLFPKLRSRRWNPPVDSRFLVELHTARDATYCKRDGLKQPGIECTSQQCCHGAVDHVYSCATIFCLRTVKASIHQLIRVKTPGHIYTSSLIPRQFSLLLRNLTRSNRVRRPHESAILLSALLSITTSPNPSILPNTYLSLW